jgi:UDP-N-acetylglucosamine 1-carboxyvinyltransferase
MVVFRVESKGPLATPLQGSTTVRGAKNSALKLMSATLLAPGESTIANVPEILDVDVMAELLGRLGCEVTARGESPLGDSRAVTVAVPEHPDPVAPYELVRRLRASICVLGPLVARCGRASVALPGGDAIGSRGLHMHLAGLEDLGAGVRVEHGQIVAEVPHGLRGAHIALDFPSVGATENLLMAAVLARGPSVIDNVAREPEIIDLCRMLVDMGACVDGIGTSTLLIDGVEGLHPVHHHTVGDRIVAGTWAFATAVAGGAVHIQGVDHRHLDIVLDKLVTAGANVAPDESGFVVQVDRRLRAFDVSTLPFPGFPTDLQPFAMALAAVCDGTSMITENVFEARFMFVQELARLGADIRTDGHHAVVRGVPELSGAPVDAHDIRAGAALVIAALAAQGTTLVGAGHHVDRGYPHFEEALNALGADVRRTA